MAVTTARRLPAIPEEVFCSDLEGFCVPLPNNPDCQEVLARALRLAKCFDPSDSDSSAIVYHIGVTKTGAVAIVAFPLVPGALYAVE